MTILRGLTALTLVAGLAVMASGEAQAKRVSKWNCPTGQTENPITALCEGPYTGAFMFVTPGYDGPGYWPHHHRRWWHHHRHHHHHH